ncbi:NADPH-dependent FMN reductase [Marinilabilia rubra]|uniref:NADPH-dependent FMN reductase n=1 Tax=Marinilabilia rubra TaxID=2162893 RepID=A0A2U2B8C5_9BACT|nr:NAD(P)H-dependent oxidoreductase [Marinilabilia rubra]PWD99318.1 NADPH-dependent FMN reductase [Marinilabilia rubra]
MDLAISLIYGSVRSSRRGIQVAKYLDQKLKEREIKVHFIDPLQYPLPMLDKMYNEYPKGEAPGNMEKLGGFLKESDGFLLVTGEYNHSIPPALKNLLDHFQKEYLFKPSAIASYSKSSFGGVRAAVHLRVILAELGTPSISSILPFPQVGDLFDENLLPRNEKTEPATKRFLDEFVWYAEALKTKRSRGIPF